MTDFPQVQGLPVSVHSLGRFGLGPFFREIGGGSAQITSFVVSQNVAVYTPIFLPFRYPVKNFFFINGTVVATSNIDMGLYNQDGAKLWSAGPTAQGTASTLQFFAKDIVLDPGFYYLALACSSTTGTVMGNVNPGATKIRWMGALQQASLTSGTLPSPATFDVFGTTPHGIPVVGFTLQSGTPNF